MNIPESMNMDQLLAGIAFDDEKQKEKIENVFGQELQKILDDPQNTIDTLEKLLLSAFRQIMPFFHMILELDSLAYFADLKGSFDDIADCQEKNIQRPFPALEHYITLCDLISYTFDDSYLEDCPKKYHKQMMRFCKAFYKEVEQKDEKTQTIVRYYNWPIFENYFYFLQYFLKENNEDRDWVKRHCKDAVCNILFNILWDLDNDFDHTEEESYFKQAMKNIFE
ncbi:MAG: hypothetical protein K2G55_08455 [Lachnospiraceae bacterium]|nr:hypothetical protein [Lachnospiraceae bacterium]